MDVPLDLHRLPLLTLAALHDAARARAVAARNEAFDAAWARLVAGARRLVRRAGETTSAQGPSATGAPRPADFR